jgi:radical SAM superfamily enzyme YgiQ (UPF0313 family)
MNILLINISLRPQSKIKLFPVGLGYIATAIHNAGWHFDLLDIDAHRPSAAEIEEAIARRPYDVVCMGCIVTGYKYVKSLSSLIKSIHPKAKIILGNTVASSIPHIVLTRTQVDYLVFSEGDHTIIELLDCLRLGQDPGRIPGIGLLHDGRVHCTPPRPAIKDLDSLPWINHDLFDITTYIGNTPDQVDDNLPMPKSDARMIYISTSRGCIANCTFCYHAFKQMPYRVRSPRSIVAEIESLVGKYDANIIAFSDDLTFFNKKQTLEFVDAVLASSKKFYWEANSRATLFDLDEDVAIIEKMKAAGCMRAGFSLESSNPDILKAMNKNITVEAFSRQARLFKQAGMQILTSLVFGFPQETPETIADTFKVCAENGVYPSIGYLLPQPGSPIYDYARSHGYIPDEEEYLLNIGDRQDLYVNMTSMSDEEFQANVLAGAKRCNDALNLDLGDRLIKTQYYRTPKTDQTADHA